MTDNTSRVDHAAEARRTMRQVLNFADTDENTGALVGITAARVHATLALVEQQRIANLIALANSTSEALEGQPAADAAGALLEFHPHEHEEFGGWHQPRPEVAAALGIEAKP